MKTLPLLLIALLSLAALNACGDDRGYSSGDDAKNNDGAATEDDAAALTDSDNDGLPNARERELGTDPQNADTDGDGILDGVEVEQGSDPLSVSSESPDDLDEVWCRPTGFCPSGAPCPNSGRCSEAVLSCDDNDADGFCERADCDDNDAQINPGAPEWPGNGIDDNCDGLIDEPQTCQVTEDCINRRMQCFSGVCAYTAPVVECNSDADCREEQLCGRGVCLNTAVDNDGDGFSTTNDCDDTNAEVYPGALEIPRDGVDNNCDGRVDEIACSSQDDCPGSQSCRGGICY